MEKRSTAPPAAEAERERAEAAAIFKLRIAGSD
jgi:hypothetical protein